MKDEILEELGNQMYSAIDFEILAEILITNYNWIRIKLDRFKDNAQAVDIKIWCEEKSRGRYRNYGSTFLFENIGDAVNFSLKWQ